MDTTQATRRYQLDPDIARDKPPYLVRGFEAVAGFAKTYRDRTDNLIREGVWTPQNRHKGLIVVFNGKEIERELYDSGSAIPAADAYTGFPVLWEDEFSDLIETAAYTTGQDRAIVLNKKGELIREEMFYIRPTAHSLTTARDIKRITRGTLISPVYSAAAALTRHGPSAVALAGTNGIVIAFVNGEVVPEMVFDPAHPERRYADLEGPSFTDWIENRFNMERLRLILKGLFGGQETEDSS